MLTANESVFTGRHTKWVCKCDCGIEKVYSATQLVKKLVVSCGCYRKTAKRKPPGYAGLIQLICRYRRTARQRNHKFLLTQEQFQILTSKNCSYCGIKPHKISIGLGPGRSEEGLARTSFVYNGIDRVNNDLGYTLENCVTCCTDCNIMKGSMTQTEFFDKIKQITDFQRRP